ncbi:hypothetical protein FQR60_001497 [Escherichia coli]|nr:hypothetical protein [Escherichia coli]ELT8669785.1 hypothetical protein [Escherichia coli]
MNEKRRQYIKELAQEIIRANQPLIDRTVRQEVDKIKAQLSSLQPNMADRRKMLAVMGSNSALGVYLANVELQGYESDIATNAFTALQEESEPNIAQWSRAIAANKSTAPQQAPDPKEYFDGHLDEFTKEYFDVSDELNRHLDDYFYMGE